MQDELINGRYQLHEKLGDGGMGAVYRATDRLTNSVIALKRVLTESRTLHLSLTNEFRALASLRHPNIIPVLDYGFHEDLPYFTMTYIPNAQPITEVSVDADHNQRVSFLHQMLEALAYLHRRGIIHHDLKPQNALVDQQGRVMLLDFGLAEENPTASTDGMISGTLAYIAPEVLQGAIPTQAADLYAAGLIAYEIFAGVYPFGEQDIPQLLTDILHTQPDIDMLPIAPEFAAIIGRLLNKKPDQRYRQATQVIQHLAQIGVIDRQAADRQQWDSYLQAARFIGRETELERLELALSDALDGRGSAWLIGGESGVGKSRLLSELEVRALVQGALVLSGQGVIGGGLPYQLWREPVQRLALLSEISSMDAAIFREIVPDIERLIGYTVDEAPAVDEETAQKRLQAAIIALFRKHQQPIVLLLEDLQWLSESLSVVDQLSQAVADLPLLILATYRSDERPDLPLQLTAMETMMLDRLTPFEIADLSESMIGISGRAPQVVDLLAKETEGNVFFLIETVRALAEEAGTLDNIGRMTLPPTVFAGGVKQVVERRLQRIPNDFEYLLRVAAVAGRQIDIALIEHLAQTINIDEWLDTCINSAVITVQDGQYRFTHDKIREGVLERISSTQHAHLSQLIASTIETLYPDDDSRVLLLAQYWQQAQETTKAIQYSYLVAKQQRPHNNHQALEYALHVLHHIEGDEDDPRLPDTLWMIGDMYLNMSSYDLAKQYFERGLELAKAQDNLTYQAYCFEGLGHLAIRQNKTDHAMHLYQQALAQAKVSTERHLIARITSSISNAHIERSEFDEARTLAEANIARSRADDDRLTLSRDFNTLGVVAYRTGDLQTALQQFEQALTIRQELGMRQEVAAALNNLGVLSSALGEFKQSIQYHDESRKLKTEIGDRFGVGNSLQNIGIAYMSLGEYEAARRYTEQALSIARTIKHRSGEADMLNNLGLIVQRLNGDLQQACDYLEQALVISSEIEDALGVALILSNLGDVLISMERYTIAWGILLLGLRTAHDLNARQPLLRTIMWIGKLIQLADHSHEAITLWSFVNLHESADIETRQDSEQLLMSVADRLSAEALANAIEASKTLTITDVVRDLQARPEPVIIA
ncbi:MAG: protein kinase domain-containing protein [Anaerolineae bacterium]